MLQKAPVSESLFCSLRDSRGHLGYSSRHTQVPVPATTLSSSLPSIRLASRNIPS